MSQGCPDPAGVNLSPVLGLPGLPGLGRGAGCWGQWVGLGSGCPSPGEVTVLLLKSVMRIQTLLNFCPLDSQTTCLYYFFIVYTDLHPLYLRI